MKTLLVAVNPDDEEAIRSALGDEYRLRVCHTLPAVRHAFDGVDGVVCGLHFDEGKLFALLEMLNAAGLSATLPVLCVKDAGGRLSASIHKSIAIAVGRMGARGFADLGELRAEHGDARARDMLRRAVRELVDGDT